MAVNYKAIADVAETYPDTDTAFSAMSSEEVTDSYRVLNGSDLRIWAGQYTEDYSNLKSASSSNVVAEIASMLVQNPRSTMDLNKVEVQGMVQGLVDAGVISEVSKDSLYLSAAQVKKKWPGLRLGHVVNALQKRERGEV